jgi:hypothetical protein
VDVVITSDAPIWGFEGQLAVDAANVVTINAADWTDRDNVLMSNGQSSATLASYYDLAGMDWLWARIATDGEVIASGADLDSLLQPDPPTAVALVNNLAALNGPIATPAGEMAGLPAGNWFVTSASLGGITRDLLPAGQTTLATLSLTVGSTPGTYHLTLAEATFTDEAMQIGPMSPGPTLEVIVQGQ